MHTVDVRPRRSDLVVTLLTVCSAAFMLPLSFAGGALATPAIAGQWGGDTVGLSGVTNAFMLSFGASLMAAGALADAWGRKRLFTAGVALFALSSLAILVAADLFWLDLLRAGQGLAAAAALAGGSAALAQTCDGHDRTRAFSLLGTTFGVGLAFGPVLAAVLLDRLGWRAVFAPGAVIGLLVLLFGVPRLRESKDLQAQGMDWRGALSFTTVLAALTWAMLQAATSGWSDLEVVGGLLLAAASLLVFVQLERRVARPMLDLSLFRYPQFVGVQLLPLATCFCYVVLLVLLPIRFVGVDAHQGTEAGWAMLPLSAPLLVMPSFAAMLSRRWSSALLSVVGLVVAAGGLLWLSRIDAAQGLRATTWPMLVIGLGTGLPWGLMDGLSLSLVPRERAGMATGIFSTVRVAGEGLVLALVTTLLVGLVQSQLTAVMAGAPTTSAALELAQAARSLAAGDMAQALQTLPRVDQEILRSAYARAFATLLQGLAAVTLIAAALVALCLGRSTRATETEGGAPPVPVVGKHTAP